MVRKTEPDRESKANPEEIPVDPEEIARREARNALRQFDTVVELVEGAIRSDKPFKLRPSTILDLNRVAIEGVNEFAGVYRPHPVEIIGSHHIPPRSKDVPVLVEEMCDYVSDHWESPPVHLAAYLMWRVNWIHPFSDGNGRTARAISYSILSIRLGHRLPGVMTIPEQISENKSPYYQALEQADAAWERGHVDVTALERLLGDKLANQLAEILRQATESQ